MPPARQLSDLQLRFKQSAEEARDLRAQAAQAAEEAERAEEAREAAERGRAEALHGRELLQKQVGCFRRSTGALSVLAVVQVAFLLTLYILALSIIQISHLLVMIM